MTAEKSDEIDFAAKLGDVRASVRPNLEVSRHIFSGATTYVVRDPVTAQIHRFTAEDYQLLVSIDQTRTLKETLGDLVKRKRLDEANSNSFYKYVVHLHQMGLLSLPLSDGNSLYKRYKQRLDFQKQGRLFKVLFMKVPLFKPDRFLSHTQHLVAPLFTIQALLIWLVCVFSSVMVLFANWREFIDPLGTMLTLQSLPILWLLLVGLKVFHEFGHAYACKIFKGHVPEMGAMFIMATPCAYVDASSSWGFPSRWHRMVVALAGMYFESMLAMIALVIWMMTDTGQLHSAAQYAIVLSTVVTIGFNANPLMRYDGYFVLSDLLNMPNLHKEAKSSAIGFIKEWLFWLKSQPLEQSRLRRAGLVLFGIACMVYQVSVSIGIATLLGFAIPIVGPIIGLSIIVTPLLKQIRTIKNYLMRSDEIKDIRGRAILTGCSLALLILCTIFLVPIPSKIEAIGVLHRRDEQTIRSGADGFITSILARPGDDLQLGQAIYHLENPDLIGQRDQTIATINQIELQLTSSARTDHREAERLRLQLISEQANLKHLDYRISLLSVQPPIQGSFINGIDKPKVGKYVSKGEPLGTVCRGPWIVKTKLTAEQWSAIVQKLDSSIQLRLIGRSEKSFTGKITQSQSSGSRKIDDVALTNNAGGNIAVSADNLANENFFEVVVQLDDPDDLSLKNCAKPGMSVMMALPSTSQTLGSRVYRRLLRLVNQFRLATS